MWLYCKTWQRIPIQTRHLRIEDVSREDQLSQKSAASSHNRSVFPTVLTCPMDVFDYYQERAENTIHMAQDVMDVEEQINEEEEEQDPARLCWANLNGNDERCAVICGFTSDQFLQLFEACEDAIPTVVGRGRRSRISKHDRLLLVLCYVKHYETYEKLAETFLMSKSQVHRNLGDTIDQVGPVLYRRYVEHISELIGVDVEVAAFPEAPLVMDATLQEIWIPTGTFQEKKRFFSGKHKKYGLKTQTLHNRRGFHLHCIPGIDGAVHDLTIARQHIIEVLRVQILSP